MLTYVINTSENKTFDSDKLFDLAGYNKIRWLNCRLSDIGQCAQYIHEKQNVLGADRFRIAVLVDFFGFDRLRIPYGRRGFGSDDGVDISLYIPYIEVFLLDNLIAYLEKREMYTEDFEVYYVQNTRMEPYEFLDNAPEQLCTILKGCPNEKLEATSCCSECRDTVPEDDPLVAPRKYPPTIPPCERIPYRAFDLYCTECVSLRFYLTDYPYGAQAMTFWEFYNAFRHRLGNKRGIRRHYYISSYGGGNARAAFDTLSLSLYLIRMYEREELIEDGEMEVLHLDADTLKEVLETAWGKINLARKVAKANDSRYFSLKQNMGVVTTAPVIDEEEETGKKSDTREKLDPEELYERVSYFFYRTPEQAAEDNREEFNRIMSAYLVRRDETRETGVEAEFEEMVRNDVLVTTTQCPSKEEYLYLVESKQKEISEIFDRALAADRIGVEFAPEKKRADKAFDQYSRAKACLSRNILGDVIFMILALLSVFVPYAVLQLSGYAMQTAEIMMLALTMLGLFGGLFILAVLFRTVPLIWKMKAAKRELRDAYADCLDKERLSMSKIRERYEQDLIRIEHIRYEIRQLKRLYEANLKKDANVQRHRDMLEEVEDRLSAILNNLDVEPTVYPDESVEGEFDLTKPIRSRENGIYRIFSIETIERMFPKKGRDA